MNLVILHGNVGRDAELKTFESGRKVATFSLATSESFKKPNSDEWETITQWHNIVAWGGLAEKAERIKKGTPLVIQGKVVYREYTAEDGTKKRVTDISANMIHIIKTERSSSPGVTEDDIVPKGNTESEDFMSSITDNLPF